MGILRRIADRLDPANRAPAHDLDPANESSTSHLEARSANSLSVWDKLGADFGHTPVNARLVESLATATACVSAISSTIASLPAYVYRRTGQGRELDEAHAVAALIRDGPNQHQSWSDWVEFTVASVLLRGNAASTLTGDNTGTVREMKPMPWENVSVQLLMNGRLAYDITSINSIFGGTGRMRRYLQGEVFHLRDRSDDGLVGKSRLTRAGAAFRAGLTLQQFVSSMFSNGVNPSGAIELDAALDREAISTLNESFTASFAGTGNAARALILDKGMKWKTISVSPEDAELLASRRFSAEEIAKIFQVPPPLVGIWDHSSFTNSETAGRWFASFTLAPWVRKIEAEFSRSVFSQADRRTHFVEIDLSGLTRGDPESRWKSHEIAVKNRILTPNEVREAEGWNPREGGDAVPPENDNIAA